MLVDSEVLIRFDHEGLIVKMHATSDASLRAALDAIEAARLANGDTVLDHEIDPHHIKNTRVPLTVIEGKAVFER